MREAEKREIGQILRILTKKGVYEIFLFVKSHDGQRYSTIQANALEKKLVKSRASVNTAITELTDLGLLKREIIQDRPVQTCYKVNSAGCKVITYLKEIEDIVNKQPA